MARRCFSWPMPAFTRCCFQVLPLVAGWALSGGSPPASCAAQPHDFQTLVFPVDGMVGDVHPVDVDGDGRCDLVTLLGPSAGGEGDVQPGRRASIYLQTESGFSPKPFQTVLLDNGEIVCQWANVQGDTKPEWLFLTPEGVRVRAWSDSAGFTAAPLLTLRCGSVLQTHDTFRLPSWTMVEDLDGNGTPVWCIPQTDRIDLYRPDGSGGFQLLQGLRIALDAELSGGETVSFRMQLPRLKVGRFDGDSLSDVFVLQRGRMHVFLGQTAARGGLRDPDVRYVFGSASAGTGIGADDAAQFDTADWNGDGLSDLLDIRRGGVFRLHVNRSGRYDPVPDASWASEGPCLAHAVRDFNRDGLADLGLLDMNTGVGGIFPLLLRQNVRIFFKCFAGRTRGPFLQKPDFSLSFSQRFALRNGLNQKVFCLFDGDLNGDGIADLAVGTDANVLTVFPGVGNGYFDKNTMFRIPAAWSEPCRTIDMNGDGVSDMLFWYPEGSSGPGRFILLQSRRPDRP